MKQLATTPSGLYRPITKTLDLSDVEAVLRQSQGRRTVDAVFAAAVPALSHTSLGRRRDVVRLVLRHVVGVEVEEGQYEGNALAELIADPQFPPREKLDVFALLYCHQTRLLAEAIRDLYLPLLDRSGVDRDETGPDDWYRWLTNKLQPGTEQVLRRTRQTQVTMLGKFGYIEGVRTHTPVARRPSPWLYACAVALDFQLHGWTTRSLDYALSPGGPRCLMMVTRQYATYCIDQAVEHALLRRTQVADAVDLSIPAGDTIYSMIERGRRSD